MNLTETSEALERAYDKAAESYATTHDPNWRLICEADAARLDALVKALPSLMVDAERYRWLRDPANQETYVGPESLVNEAFDAAIDAARKP